MVCMILTLFACAVYRFSHFPLIKCQGTSFLTAVFVCMYVCTIISYTQFCVSLWSYEDNREGFDPQIAHPMNLRPVDCANFFFVPYFDIFVDFYLLVCLYVCLYVLMGLLILFRFAQTVMMGLLIGRIRLINKLFVKSPNLKHSPKENTKTQVVPIVVLLVCQAISLIPWFVFTGLWNSGNHSNVVEEGYM
eukprot:Pgem_evm1s6805